MSEPLPPTSFMAALSARPSYPEGHMGNHIIDFERRFNNLFGGQLRLQFIVPSDHVQPDGTVDPETLKTEISALLAVDDAENREHEKVTRISKQLARRILDQTGGAAFDADHLLPEAADPHNLRGIIYPGTKSFRSGALITAYTGDASYGPQVYTPPLSDPVLSLDRVLYHEIGHKILHFLDRKKHPLADKCSQLPMVHDAISDDDFKEYFHFRDESFADGFMALMMVRDHGDVGKKYAQMIGHMRGLGFENGIHKYYTTHTIGAALNLADELGDDLAKQPVEELAVQLYARQHKAMWNAPEYLNARTEQKEFGVKALEESVSTEELQKYRWLLQLRDTHETALMNALAHPEATADAPEKRAALIADYTAERRAELDFIWANDLQKQAALYQEKTRLRLGIEKSASAFEEDELAEVLLDKEELLGIYDTLSAEYSQPMLTHQKVDEELGR